MVYEAIPPNKASCFFKATYKISNINVLNKGAEKRQMNIYIHSMHICPILALFWNETETGINIAIKYILSKIIFTYQI